MAFFGLNFPEDDDLKDLSIELTSHKEWLDRIQTQGNRPEDWVEFIEHTKSQFSLSHNSFRNAWICDLYVKALQSIPGDLSKNNVMFVKLLIDYANLKSEDHVEDGHILFSQARKISRKFAIAHIAAAEFELKQGDKAKCQKILEQGEIFRAEPARLLKRAFQNLKAGKSYLLTASDKNDYFEKKTEIEEEKKPSLTMSVSLPDRSTKNKFLVDMRVSHAPVISTVKSEPHSSSEKVFQPTDPFGSSEKWTSGHLLSEKWGSCGNFPPSDGRLSNIFSAPDHRLSSIHNIGDRRLSSINPVTDRRLSNIHSVAPSHGPSLSFFSHQTTPDSHNPHKNGSDNNSSGGSSSSSISRLFNVTSRPGRVKIDSKTVHDELDSDSDDTNGENNTIPSGNPAGKAAGPLSFRTRYCINPITEEGNPKSSLNSQESLKTAKVDHKSSSRNEKNNNVNINMFSIDDDDDDDIPQLPTPPKLSLSFMRSRCETPNIASASLSTPSASIAGEHTKPSTAFRGSLKSQIAMNKHCLETNNIITPVSTSAEPHFFAEPKPVAKFVKPPQPKCHPDTPRPGTGTPPLSVDKETFVAPPPPQSRRCLDGVLKSSSPATTDSLTMSKTISPCAITVCENITNTVVFEGKPADGFETPSELPQTKIDSFQGTPSSSLSSSSSPFLSFSRSKRPYLSDLNPFKLDSASSRPNPLLPYCDKENRSASHMAPAKFGGGKSSRPNLKESLSEHAEIAPTPAAANLNPDKLSDSRLGKPFLTERAKPIASPSAETPTVEKLEKASQPVASYEAERPETFLRESASATPMSELHHKERRETGKMFNRDVDRKEKLLPDPLSSVEDRSHLKKLNVDKNRSVPDAEPYVPFRESLSAVQTEKKPTSQKDFEPVKNEIIVPQPLVDERKESKPLEGASGKGPPPPLPVENLVRPNDVQSKEQKPTPVQTKPELESQKSQQKRVENPVSSSEGPVTYTMNLNQPIQSKKHRSLNINGKSYMILKMIGRGGSSKVYKVLDQSYNMMAVKHIDFEGANEATVQSYMNEVTLLKRLQYSDLVVKLYDFELDYEENCIYLVLECGETDLSTMFKNRTKKEKIPREMVKFYWGEMLRAVQVLHKEGIVHSDLKPANFLIIGGNLKLIDFGIAGVIQNDRTSMTRDTQMGTLNYMSPETILEMQSDTGNRLHKFKISVKSDVWSLGCILYSMIYGKTPFQHITNTSAKLQAIINVNHNIEFGDEQNADLVDTMKKCLCRNPKERLSISELLQHPYLAEPTKAAPLAPSTPNVNDDASGDSRSWVADVQCIFDKLVDANVASPNTITMLKKTLFQKLSSKKDINEILSQLPRSKKTSQSDVNAESENIGKTESKVKCANGSVKEVRAPLQCLNLKDLRRE